MAAATACGIAALAPEQVLAKKDVNWQEAFDSARVVLWSEIRKDSMDVAANAFDERLSNGSDSNLKRIKDQFKNAIPNGNDNYKGWNAEQAEYVYTNARMIGLLARRKAAAASSEVTLDILNQAIDDVVTLAKKYRLAANKSGPPSIRDVYCYN
jgi:hypothetical protein